MKENKTINYGGFADDTDMQNDRKSMTTMNTEPGEALACCLCSKPLTTLPNETAYCRNLKSNPSSFDDWKANSCPMARQSTCLPIVVWKALNASRAPLAAVGGDADSERKAVIGLIERFQREPHRSAGTINALEWLRRQIVEGNHAYHKFEPPTVGFTKPDECSRCGMPGNALMHLLPGAAAASSAPAEPPEHEFEGESKSVPCTRCGLIYSSPFHRAPTTPSAAAMRAAEGVKRFSHTYEDGIWCMDERPDGKWVRYSDYERLADLERRVAAYGNGRAAAALRSGEGEGK